MFKPLLLSRFVVIAFFTFGQKIVPSTFGAICSRNNQNGIIIQLFFTFLCLTLSAQQEAPPQKMSYQAVVRNAQNQLIQNNAVSMRLSILQGSSNGTAVYVETHTPIANGNGTVTIEIGNGNVVSGVFEDIDWGCCTYFLQTETDPQGLASYSITGVSQLLSVPYALYSGHAITADSLLGGFNEIDGDTTNELQTISISNDTLFLSNGNFALLPKNLGGQTHLYIYGNVTNAEADSIIANEAGPRTQEISIINTTSLTSVTIPNVNSLVSLTIEDNEDLAVVNLPDVTDYIGNISVKNNSNLSDLTVPNLTNCNLFTISGNDTLNINFSSLQKARLLTLNNNFGGFNVDNLQECENLTITSNSQLSFPSLNYVRGTIQLSGGMTLNLSDLDSCNILHVMGYTLDSLNLTSLKKIFYLNMDNAGINGGLSLPMLEEAGTMRFATPFGLTSISCPLLATLHNTFTVNNAFYLSSIDLSSFTGQNSGGIAIYNNVNLQSIDLQSIVFSNPSGSNDGLQITNNSNLSVLNLPAINSDGNFYLVGNAFSIQTVNNLLNHFAISSFTQDGGNGIFLQNQNPPATPSGQGIIDKNLLISNGNNVVTD